MSHNTSLIHRRSIDRRTLLKYSAASGAMLSVGLKSPAIAQTRPIAGTRPRTRDDASRIRELIANPKERAEHVMLIDLERNDLGRVCEAGSIHVDELMSVESYAHVHHIVSNVRGTLRANTSPGDVIRVENQGDVASPAIAG